MRVDVLKLNGPVFQGEASEVLARTETGDITILDHHEPLITILRPGKLSVIDLTGVKKDFEAMAGFVEVRHDNSVHILLD